MIKKDFITCKYDRAFKEVFLKEENKDLLIDLLETCLPYQIRNIKYLNIEQSQGNINVKRKVLDVLLDTDQGKINVEVNSNIHSYTKCRNTAYICNIYARSTLVGKEYSEDVRVDRKSVV